MSCIKCEICGCECKSSRGLALHINKKHIDIFTLQQYYNKYLMYNNDNKCIDCGALTIFVNLSDGYKQYCEKCTKKHHYENIQKTLLKNYGVTNPSKSKEIQNKKVKTFIKNFGETNPMRNSEIKEKVRISWKNKTEYDRQQIFQSSKNTLIERYNDEHYNNREKYKQTCIEKYGVDWYTQTDESKQKIKQSNLNKYGVENVSQSDIIKNKKKETSVRHYGVEHPMQLSLFKEKIKQTCIEKYGVDYYQQSNIYLLRLENIRQKIYETKKKNHTFNTSTIEEQFAEYLIENGYKIERQYKSDEYPFACDFYIPRCDLYIEINGSWTHGNHPFNENNPNDIELLNKWKSKNTKYYDNAIYTWTKLDVKKQQIANENNLNYLPIYSNNIDEIINLFNIYIHNNRL